MSESLPIAAQKGAYKMQLDAGKAYWWCACGKSAQPPFCNGSHKATTCAPMTFKAAETSIVSFCGCKGSAKTPRCDGSHRNLA